MAAVELRAALSPALLPPPVWGYGLTDAPQET